VHNVSWAAAVACLLLISAGCTNSLPPLTIALSPATPQTINQAEVVNVTASVSHDPSQKGVSWALSPNIGSLENQSTTSASYRAPATVTTNSIVTITATSLTDAQTSVVLVVRLLAPGPRNVQPILVTNNPTPNQTYINGPFTSVTICAAGTSNCQIVNGILVDTGSVGLRIFKSAVTVPFQTLTQSGGTVNNCISFLGGSYFWGQVASADVYIAGETAAGISMQLIADPVGYDVPAKCSNGAVDGVTVRQFNGILGVGDEPTDCTFAGSNPCDPSSGTSSPPVYFVCFGSEGCATTLLPKAQQVSNPIVSFPGDNNGSIIQFPSVGEALPSVNGTLTFGINTESTNDIGNATIFPISSANNGFTTRFAGQALTQSFIDSGSNALFFPNITGLQVCSSNSFYCPSNAPVMLSATNQGASNTGSGTVDFLVDNYSTDTQANPGAAAFGYIAGQNGQPPCQSGKGDCTFDWGLPFFYDRRVFTSIDQQTVAAEPKTPWWAY
jgi:Protein of unknown function (DUF3443)